MKYLEIPILIHSISPSLQLTIKSKCSKPEGAKHFAIRCISRDQYILYIDDVTYRPAKSGLELVGYNVYRNGQLLNTTPLTATTYTDNAPAGTHTYTVTVVYNEGESIHSNEYVNVITAISGTAAGATTVKAGRGCITVCCADSQKVSIAGVGGRTVYTGSGPATIALPEGLYIVKAGTATVKAYVK